MTERALQFSFATSGRGWGSAWRGRAKETKDMIERAAGDEAFRPVARGVLEIEFSSDAAVRDLNRRFRGKDSATNVLSFANPSAPIGSIVLAFETIQREAGEQGKSFVFHSKHMILHGFLHLCGFDHEAVSDRRLMERVEIRILASMGIPNPYLLAK